MAAYSEDLGELHISDFETSSYSLTSTYDQHLISPNSIFPESHIKVMRIKENDLEFKKLLIVRTKILLDK